MLVDKPEIKFVSKAWGFEKIICNDKYCGKILFIVKNHKTSLHFHQIKDETFYVQSGRLLVYYSDELAKIKDIATVDDEGFINPTLYESLSKINLNRGDSFYVPPRRVHQIIALEDSELIEFSTKHFDKDSNRLINGE